MASFSIASGRPIHGHFTSEAVSDGHPDKICDQISDAIVDAALAVDPHTRVAVETAAKAHHVFLLGEINCSEHINILAIVQDVLADVGHDADGKWGLALKDLSIWGALSQQSREITEGVGYGSDLGAGDQGIMFGYATNESAERLPLPYALARRLILRHKALRSAEYSDVLGPDAKAQVTLAYRGGVPTHATHVVLSTQHGRDSDLQSLRDMVRVAIIETELAEWLTSDTQILVNPAGTFHVGGAYADAGLTGRKIIADTYGGLARHGGGAFSGKDPTKVDRSAAYMARHVARSVVDQGWVSACEVRVAYAIGQAEPIAVDIEADGASNTDIAERFAQAFDASLEEVFRPSAIIDHLGLRRPLYRRSARFGHFGLEEFPWEQRFDAVTYEDLGTVDSPGRQTLSVEAAKLFTDRPSPHSRSQTK